MERTIYYNRAMLLYMLSALGTLLALWMLVQGVFFFAVSDLLNSARAMERTRFLEVQESQFAAQQRYIKATERVRHDFRHSITTLRELYDSGEYEALGRYLDRFKDAQPKKEVVTYTDNIAVNALLNYYAHLAARNRLDYRVQVKLPEALSVTDMDLCTMIGNIMDNAGAADFPGPPGHQRDEMEPSGPDRLPGHGPAGHVGGRHGLRRPRMRTRGAARRRRLRRVRL